MNEAATLAHVNDAGEEHEALLARLRRVEGQIRGLQRLLEDKAPCETVAQQLFAAKSALEKVAVRFLIVNMRRCMVREMTGDATARRALDRIAETFARLA